MQFPKCTMPFLNSLLEECFSSFVCLGSPLNPWKIQLGYLPDFPLGQKAAILHLCSVLCGFNISPSLLDWVLSQLAVTALKIGTEPSSPLHFWLPTWCLPLRAQGCLLNEWMLSYTRAADIFTCSPLISRVSSKQHGKASHCVLTTWLTANDAVYFAGEFGN